MSQVPRFEELTETTGIPLSAEGASMMATRYNWAAEYCTGQRVLEIGGGSGLGWSLFSAGAESVVCGDFSMPLLQTGRRHIGMAFRAVALSADSLPFCDDSFDVVVLFEALYYVPDSDAAFSEIRRVLSPGGTVLFANANPERPDFIRSPHSVRYYSADALSSALSAHGFTVETYAAFPVEQRQASAGSALVSFGLQTARKVASRLGLIPRTLRGRARIKKLIFGKLTLVPPLLSKQFAPTAELVAMPPGNVATFKVIYAVGRALARQELSPPRQLG